MKGMQYWRWLHQNAKVILLGGFPYNIGMGMPCMFGQPAKQAWSMQ
ncbi:hypothetical protein LHGZ1_1236 [Laribacter hongkongensis]|uniref:Uncharacterized protein n=1 Tax=Laribacter hongkongensis TaxID=168471 RepID=A0A248LH29_9NEIS|nr:hypothetical protein LHGZ1_1236 [Laribacter hongkongensis]